MTTWSVYAIRSMSRNYMYVGMASDVSKRIKQHNDGKESTTRPYRPFVLVYTEMFTDRPLARVKEKWLKIGFREGIP